MTVNVGANHITIVHMAGNVGANHLNIGHMRGANHLTIGLLTVM